MRNVATQAELAVVIPCLDEAENLEILMPRMHEVLAAIPARSEVWVVDGGSTDGTPETAERLGARVIRRPGCGYGGALKAAFETVGARWIATLDADLSHPPSIVRYLWESRERAHVVIGSRRIEGGYSWTSHLRRLLSCLLNAVFRRALAVPVRDLSSGFRLYDRRVFDGLALRHSNYAILEEILVKAYCSGYRIVEVPFHYMPRRRGSSHARLWTFGIDFFRVLCEMRRLRRQVACADYETRAFHSLFLLRRWLERRRYKIVVGFVGDAMRLVEIRCGSSQILNGAPQSVGVDPRLGKMRFMQRPGRRLACAASSHLPFRDGVFEAAVCSQALAVEGDGADILSEACRVLEPGGSLVLGVFEGGSRRRRIAERLARLVRRSIPLEARRATRLPLGELDRFLRDFGFEILERRTVLGGETIVLARKRLPEA